MIQLNEVVSYLIVIVVIKENTKSMVSIHLLLELFITHNFYSMKTTQQLPKIYMT